MNGTLDVCVFSLPCQRSRHRSCAGAITLGIANRREAYSCGCSCHTLTQAPLQPVG